MAKAGVAYDMGDLKTYLTTGEGRRYAEGVVALDITHNLIARNFVEIPFETSWSILRCKEKIFTMMGTQIETMVLSLNDQVMENTRYLADYQPQTGMVLRVVDNDPFSKAKGGGLDNVKLVKKYEISEEDYDKRENTYRGYKRRMLAADPNWKPVGVFSAPGADKPKTGVTVEEKLEVQPLEEVQKRVKVGDRCEVVGGRRGEVMYIGLVPEIKSEEDFIWIGVKFDEATGKNDGKVGGKRYFEADASCGGFIKSPLVEAGDFPEIDPFASDDDEDVMEEL